MHFLSGHKNRNQMKQPISCNTLFVSFECISILLLFFPHYSFIQILNRTSIGNLFDLHIWILFRCKLNEILRYSTMQRQFNIDRKSARKCSIQNWRRNILFTMFNKHSNESAHKSVSVALKARTLENWILCFFLNQFRRYLIETFFFFILCFTSSIAQQHELLLHSLQLNNTQSWVKIKKNKKYKWQWIIW